MGISVHFPTSSVASRLRLVQQTLVGVAPGLEPSPLLHGLQLVLHLADLTLDLRLRAAVAPVPQPVELLLGELASSFMAEDLEATYQTKHETDADVGDDGRVVGQRRLGPAVASREALLGHRCCGGAASTASVGPRRCKASQRHAM